MADHPDPTPWVESRYPITHTIYSEEFELRAREQASEAIDATWRNFGTGLGGLG